MNAINLLRKPALFLALLVVFCQSLLAEGRSRPGFGAGFPAFPGQSSELFKAPQSEEFEGEEDFGDAFSEEAFEGVLPEEEGKKSDFEKELKRWLLASRVTLRHEYSRRTRSPERTVNNRSSLRLELSRFLGERFFVKIDSEADLFYRDDHRIRKDLEKEYMIETRTREAYLQFSFGNSSFKLGYQVLVWGESDGRAITDVVSPRDMSEFFFIPLEESRVGQLMLVVDQYGVLGGDLTLFYTPKAEFDKQPDSEGDYYIDFIPGFPIKTEEYGDGDNLEEYGARWKLSSGKSDVAFMVASLIENTCAYKGFEFNEADFKLSLERTERRYLMTGVAFNYAFGSYLLRGEIAGKSKRSFNTREFGVLDKDVLDASLGVEHTSSGGYRLSADISSSRILDWDDDILIYSENDVNMLFNWSKKFFNDELSVDASALLGFTHSERLYIVETGYDYDDQIKLELSFLFIELDRSRSPLWPYRDQNRVTARFSYLF